MPMKNTSEKLDISLQQKGELKTKKSLNNTDLYDEAANLIQDAGSNNTIN